MTALQDRNKHHGYGLPVSRRVVTKGVAWTIPAVAFAAAAPAMASSGPAPTFILGGGVKAPGGSCLPLKKGYGIPITVTNHDSKEIEIWQIVITLNTSGLSLTVNTDLLPVTVSAGGSLTFWFNAQSQNSANQAFNLGIDIYWRHTNEIPPDTSHEAVYYQVTIPSTPPGCDTLIPLP